MHRTTGWHIRSAVQARHHPGPATSWQLATAERADGGYRQESMRCDQCPSQIVPNWRTVYMYCAAIAAAD
eukprot:895845-Alexandrium_andersonii.AAC.1